MTADPVKDWALYWYEKLQIEALLRSITPHAPRPGFHRPQGLPRDRREAVFLFVLEDQAQHGEKVGGHVAVHEFVAGPSRHDAALRNLVAIGRIADS